jgi:protein CMS1
VLENNHTLWLQLALAPMSSAFQRKQEDKDRSKASASKPAVAATAAPRAKPAARRASQPPPPSSAKRAKSAAHGASPSRAAPAGKPAGRPVPPSPAPPAAADAGQLAAWFVAAHTHALPKLSAVERSGLTAGATFHVSAGDDAVKAARAGLLSASAAAAAGDAGSGPVVLCVSHSTDRAVELLKALHDALRTPTAKLFARHLKPEEQAEFLRASAVGAAVGTPNRLLKLAAADALPLARLRVVVLDLVPDVKTFTLLTMPQVSQDFFQLWTQALLREGVHVVLMTRE